MGPLPQGGFLLFSAPEAGFSSIFGTSGGDFFEFRRFGAVFFYFVGTPKLPPKEDMVFLIFGTTNAKNSKKMLTIKGC